MKKLLLCLGVILFIFSSCDEKIRDKVEDGYLVEGEVMNAPKGMKLYLEEMTRTSLNIIDTSSVDKQGEFEMNGVISEKGIYRLRMGENPSNMQRQQPKAIILILEPNDHIEINANYNDLTDYRIDGSEESQVLKGFMNQANELKSDLQQLQIDFQKQSQTAENIDQLKVSIQKQYNQRIRQHIEYVKGFIDTVESPYLALFAAEFLNPKEEQAYLKELGDRLESDLSDFSYYQNFRAKISQMGQAAKGKEAPDISLPNPDGEEMALSELKGKVVLVEFWASWCRPCRVENPHLVRLYDKYKDDGFAIFSVSLDKNKDRWVQAIKQDNLKWDYHVSDLQGWQSSAAQKYSVNSIPASFVLNEKGEIIAKNVRGHALEEKIKEALGG